MTRMRAIHLNDYVEVGLNDPHYLTLFSLPVWYCFAFGTINCWYSMLVRRIKLPLPVLVDQLFSQIALVADSCSTTNSL